MDNRPIGVFDSGVGGLTVIKSMLDQLPDETFIYFGDTAHVPYGSKTSEQLMGYAQAIIAYLLSRNAKAIVIACGTHSSVTLPHIKNQYSFPLLGVVKAAARSAFSMTSNQRIGVLATHATVMSKSYTRAIKELQPEAQVFEIACPKFVPLVEAGRLDGEETRQAVQEYVGPLLEAGVDTIVLGCTHYPFLAQVIQEYAGSQVALVDPSHQTVEELKIMLAQNDLLAPASSQPDREFYVSGNNESFFTVGKLLIGDVIEKVDRIDID